MLGILRNRYCQIAVVALVVFVVVWIAVGIGAALFWSALLIVVLVYLNFDPRIKRHW